MQWLPNPENGRFLALALLAVALLVVYLGGVHWWFTQRHLDLAAEIADLKQREARFRSVAAARAEVEARLAEVRQYEAANPAFLTETDYDSAAAGLTTRLKQVVAAHAVDPQSCQIVMNQYSPRSTEKELYEKAGIRVRLRCSLEEFTPMLHDLESGSPMLFVDEVQIWKQTGYRAPGSNQVTSYLDVQFTLSGYMRRPPVQRAAAEGGGA